MAHYRDPGSIDKKILDAVNRLSPLQLIEATGKSQDHFYKISKPTNDWGLHLQDAISIDMALLKSGQQDIFFSHFSNVMAQFARPKMQASDPLTALLKITAEIGDVAKCVNDAMEKHSDDGRALSLNERRNITEEIWDVKDQLDAMLEIVEPPAISGVDNG